ncbi:restriction endonuclease subunit S [Pectobacterium sp. CHL-2024]|uniref:restriction endonuclease subunit S n=1 Tax=Pectobacterium sp. CHL-2024 TaxID=3377079 RepID=UPI0037FC6583
MSVEKLPEGWVKTSIEAISVKCVQRTPNELEEFIYVDIGSINRDLKMIESPQYLLGQDAPSRARKAIKAGDIIVSLTRPNLNAVALVSEKYDGQIASTGFEVIRPYLIESRYIFALVRSRHFIDSISGLVQGALYPAAKSSDVQSYEFPLPSFAEQKIIAEKLDTLLAQVDITKTRLEQIPKILKRFRQAVLASAVCAELTKDWKKALGTKEWKRIQLKELCTSISDGDHQAPPKSETGVPFLVISDVNKGIIDFENVTRWVPFEYYEKLKDIRKAVQNDILYTVTGSFGIPVIVNTDKSFCFQRHIAIIKPNHLIVNYKYLAIYLGSPQALKYANEVATGTAQKTVSLSYLRKLEIFIPDLSEQHEIVRRVEQLFAYADTIEKQVNTALSRVNNLTQSILAKAFRGELTAQWREENPDLISGENSAVALLEKIKAERATSGGKKAPRKKA